MPFDANLVLCDGSYDWSYANLVTNGYGHPHSTTAVGGFVVIDQLNFSTMAAPKGMSAVFLTDQAGAATTDALVLIIQGSDDVDFVADASNDVHTLCTFEVGGVTAGVILGNETPCTVIRRFNTRLRYIRAYAQCVDGDNFYTCYVMLSPYPVETM